jgi:Mg-chelatase subunit ChlD
MIDHSFRKNVKKKNKCKRLRIFQEVIMKRSINLLAILFLLALPLQVATAQSSSPGILLEEADLTTFPQVSLRFSAWDNSGLPLPTLGTVDIELREDNGSPFHPTQVKVDQQAALQVVLVLDISGSMTGQPLVDAQAAAARFLDRLRPGDQAALLAFSDAPNPDPAVLDPVREIGFTSDLGMLYDAIEGLQAGGYTHLYEAVSKSVRMLEVTPGGHRAVLLLSDGRNDPTEAGDPQEAIQLAQAAHIPLFVIGLGDQIDEPYLRQLASETGGVFRSAPHSSELAGLFGDMATLLKTQYLLTYTSGLPADGGSHVLSVKVNSTQGSTEAIMEFGPLPLAGIPTITLTPLPLPTATIQPPSPTPQPTSTPLPTFVEQLGQLWGYLLAAIIALGLGLWLVLWRNNRRHTKPEVCANCGFDLTGTSGACPQCGATRRLPKAK